MALKDHFSPSSLGIRGLSNAFALADRIVSCSVCPIDRFEIHSVGMLAICQSRRVHSGPQMFRLPIRAFRDFDRVNFFLAAMLAGFGPYVAAYLANENWSQAEIGFVLSAGSVAALLSQLPGGELLDKVRSKRAVIAIGTGIVIRQCPDTCVLAAPAVGLHRTCAARCDRRLSWAGDRCNQSWLGWALGAG